MTYFVVKKTVTVTGEEPEVTVISQMHATKKEAEQIAKTRLSMMFEKATAGSANVRKLVWDVDEGECYITVVSGDNTETTTSFDIVELSI